MREQTYAALRNDREYMSPHYHVECGRFHHRDLYGGRTSVCRLLELKRSVDWPHLVVNPQFSSRLSILQEQPAIIRKSYSGARGKLGNFACLVILLLVKVLVGSIAIVAQAFSLLVVCVIHELKPIWVILSHCKRVLWLTVLP